MHAHLAPLQSCGTLATMARIQSGGRGLLFPANRCSFGVVSLKITAMKVKFGAIVVAGRNKIGGHVASANRGGAYFRTKVTPINPRTSFQTLVRQRLTSLAQAWRALTQAQRDGWNAAVDQYARTDIFGDIRNPSGVNLFQRLNNNLLAVGIAVINDAPPAQDVAAVELVDASIPSTLTSIQLTFSGAIPSNSAVKLFATPALSPGINFVLSEYRQIGTIAPGTATPFEAEPLYLARFGALIPDQKVFFAVEFVNTTTGQTSTRQSVSAFVES